MAKYYDFKKEKGIIEEKIAKGIKIKEVSIGMQEDWFWTATTIYENGKFTQKYKEWTDIMSSNWATPVLELVYKNGKNTSIPCWLEETEELKIIAENSRKLLMKRLNEYAKGGNR